MDEKVRALVGRGVIIPNPLTVFVGDDIDPDMISPGATLYPGCRITGKKTSIMAGTRLGSEAPVVVEDCQIAHDVELKGGFFRKSVFLDRSNMGLSARVRDACILEEEAGGGHSVGLKHTILLPFVTLGSLINFCDCLMAGGTSRKNHSEVGSSYIHFNCTPNQDKAAPSLIGDVPKGVMLDEKPIFLGGQGGIVGPALIAYGTVTAAGTIIREDIFDTGKIVLNGTPKPEVRDFHPNIYWGLKRKVRNNIIYIANLIALKSWYRLVRSQFFGPSAQEQALLKGALEKLDMAIDERINRLGAVAMKMPESIRQYNGLMKGAVTPIVITRKKELFENWGAIEERLGSLKAWTGDVEARDDFLTDLVTGEIDRTDYIRAIQGLDPATKSRGTSWLEGIVAFVSDSIYSIIPAYR